MRHPGPGRTIVARSRARLGCNGHGAPRAPLRYLRRRWAQSGKGKVHEELKRILGECYEIGYTAGYFRNDLANSNPAELCLRYTLNPPTSGLLELQQRGRLDLSVENVVWRFRKDFPHEAVARARDRLEEFGFDVRTQTRV
jgi:hypothetical protein